LLVNKLPYVLTAEKDHLY